MAFGSTPLKPSSPRSSASIKTSITRTGLSSPTQSPRHSGKSVLWPRSKPSTKRFISTSRRIRENHISSAVFTQARSGADENPVPRLRLLLRAKQTFSAEKQTSNFRCLDLGAKRTSRNVAVFVCS